MHSVLFLPSFIEVTTHTDESPNKIGKGAGLTLRRFDVSNILLTKHRVVSKCIQVLPGIAQLLQDIIHSKYQDIIQDIVHSKYFSL